MEVQLRPPRAHFHPLYRPASRRRPGMGATYTPLDCTTDLIAGGNAIACVEENQRRQAQYFLDDYNERLAGFIAACNRDWQLNDDQYKALGLPRPVNDCAQRTYGLTAPGGTTGGQVQQQIPVTYMPPPPPPPAPSPATVTAPSPAVLHPAQTETYVAQTRPPAPSSTGLPNATGSTAGQGLYLLEQPSLGGFPGWVILAAVGAGLYFMTRGK